MQNSFGKPPRILGCHVSDRSGCEVVACGQNAHIMSGSFPAWHISLCNAIGSAEGIDIIPKLSHPDSMPTTLQTRYLKLEFSTTKLAKKEELIVV